MNIEEVWAELENDMAWRQAEIRALSNLQASTRRDAEKAHLRRALLVMLYAHTEGFCKLAFLTYVNAINKAMISCSNAADGIAAAAFTDVFHALTYGDEKRRVFLASPPEDKKLTILARQREFFTELPRLLARQIQLPDTVVNTEDNLSSKVVKRNVYRLGLPESLLSNYYTDLDELVNRRNNIAHGGDGDPVKERDYERLQKSAFGAMDELALSIVSAIEGAQYSRQQLSGTTVN